MPERDRPGARRTFGPVVLLGGAAGALAAVSGSRPWVVDTTGSADPMGLVSGAGEMPLAAALSLVVLACWGVLLVTRARVRRVVAGLGLLAALGLCATVVVGRLTLEQQVVDALVARGVTDGSPEVGTSAWFWAAAVAALASVAATAAAVRFAPGWPEMGGRYDAPGTTGTAGTAGTAADPEEASSLDLWKALDEGRDPTA